MKRPLVPEPDLVEVLEVLVEQPLGLTEISLEEDDGCPAPDDDGGDGGAMDEGDPDCLDHS